MLKDYYGILGVEPTASIEEIKTAFRKLSKKFHPDNNDGDNYFENKLRELIEAYEILSNQENRKDYDAKYHKQKSGFEPFTNYTTKSKETNKQEQSPKQSNQPRKKRNGILILIVTIVLFSAVRTLIKKGVKEYTYNKAMTEYHAINESNNATNISTIDSYSKVNANELYNLKGTLKYKLYYGPPNFGEKPLTDKKEYSFILELDSPILFFDKEAFGAGVSEKVESVHLIDVDNKFNLEQFIDKKVQISSSMIPAMTGHHHAKVISWDFKNIMLIDNSLSKDLYERSDAPVFIGKITEIDTDYNAGGVRILIEKRIKTSSIEKEYHYSIIEVGKEEWFNVTINDKIYSLLGKDIEFSCHVEGSGGFLYLDEYKITGSE